MLMMSNNGLRNLIKRDILAKTEDYHDELVYVSNKYSNKDINQRLMPLHKNLFIESNPIPVKWACYKLGLIADPTLRLPLTLLSESAQPVVLDALNFAGLR